MTSSRLGIVRHGGRPLGPAVPAHQGFHARGNAGASSSSSDGGGALLLAPFAVRRGAFAPLVARWKALVALALVELAVPWFFLFNAEKKISSSLAGLFVAAVPIAGAIIARVTGTDRLDGRRAAGLVLGVAGVAALVGFDVGGSDLLSAASLLLVSSATPSGPGCWPGTSRTYPVLASSPLPWRCAPSCTPPSPSSSAPSTHCPPMCSLPWWA